MNVLNDLFYYMFMVFGLINTVHFGLYIGGANVYDIWQVRRKSDRRVTRRRHRVAPLVSVIIPAHNEELSIERCLDSIRKSTHRKREVIVHNDRSTDRTRKIVNAYKKKYPYFDVRIVNRRHWAGKAGGVNYCIKKYAKGELIMTLDADCILGKDALKNAVTYFRDPKIVGVAANVRLESRNTVIGILQRFEHLIGYRSKKFYTMANCEFIVGGVASTYRREILDHVGYYDTDTQTEDIGLSMKVVALGNRENRIVYASDVVAMTEGAQTMRALLRQRYRWKMGTLQNLFKYAALMGTTNSAYSKTLAWYRLPMAFLSEVMLLCQPFILGYVTYISIRYHTPVIFLGAYVTITLYMLWTIWPDEHASRRRKLNMSLYAPLLYFTFYVMDFVQIVAIVRCLLQPKLVRRAAQSHGGWISPERSGRKMQLSEA